MNDWSAGYVADIAYTFGYYTELNPLRIKLAFLNNGLVYPEFGTACELGFGQGLSANIHAAASVTKWYGTDFSPAQASFGQELSRIAGTDTKLFDDSFEEFLARTDLPDFDYIGLHGIWSWVSDANRNLIVEFLKRKLKVGGVVYVSYNTMPGWAAFAPMRHLMTEHAEIIGSEGRGIVSRIDDAIEFADSLLATNPIFSRANPLVGDRIKILKDQSRHYLAHEYFNKDWHPMHFATMAEWLEPAKLQYACSANYLDHVDSINLTAEQQQFLKNIPDPMFRESVRDFMVNQQFRRDYWVKGLRYFSPMEKIDKFSTIRVVLICPYEEVVLKVTGSLGKADMSPEIYKPILEILADYKPKLIQQILKGLEHKGITPPHVFEAILLLAGTGQISIAQDDSLSSAAKDHTDRLNAHLIGKSRDSGEINFLASPVIGGGISVSRFQQLFIEAISKGFVSHEEWAEYAWSNLKLMNEKILIEGSVLETEGENLRALNEQAQEFAKVQLPLFKFLKIL